MGLIAGFLLPILEGIPLVLSSPFDWVRAPWRQLRTVSDYRGTISWLPNFAYNFMADKVRDRDLEGVDLGSWRAVINCSVPVRWASHKAFFQRFEKFHLRWGVLQTCYAMAENVFAVTQSDLGLSPARCHGRQSGDKRMSGVHTEPIAAQRPTVFEPQTRLRSWLRWHNLRLLPIPQLLIVGLFVIVALFGEWLAPHDPYETSLRARLLPPAWVEGGDVHYLLGSDRLGRDVLSRIIVGARPSFNVALAALVFGSVLGSFVGMIAGFIGGWVDAINMRFADATMAFPLILAALLLLHHEYSSAISIETLVVQVVL